MYTFSDGITFMNLFVCGIIILSVITLYQAFERWKLHYMFQNPTDDLTKLFMERNPKLKLKLQKVYGKRLTLHHKHLVTDIYK